MTPASQELLATKYQSFVADRRHAKKISEVFPPDSVTVTVSPNRGFLSHLFCAAGFARWDEAQKEAAWKTATALDARVLCPSGLSDDRLLDQAMRYLVLQNMKDMTPGAILTHTINLLSTERIRRIILTKVRGKGISSTMQGTANESATTLNQLEETFKCLFTPKTILSVLNMMTVIHELKTVQIPGFDSPAYARAFIEQFTAVADNLANLVRFIIEFQRENVQGSDGSKGERTATQASEPRVRKTSQAPSSTASSSSSTTAKPSTSSPLHLKGTFTFSEPLLVKDGSPIHKNIVNMTGAWSCLAAHDLLRLSELWAQEIQLHLPNQGFILAYKVLNFGAAIFSLNTAIFKAFGLHFDPTTYQSALSAAEDSIRRLVFSEINPERARKFLNVFMVHHKLSAGQ